jgi:hypothetical protein
MVNKNKDSVAKILEEYGEFISISTELLVNPRYNLKANKGRLRHNSVILYGFLSSLLNKQNNKDEEGNTYVIVTGNDIATVVGTTTSSTPSRMLKQLEKFKLIERRTTKRGRPYELYIKEIVR